MTMLDLTLKARRAALLAGHDTELDVLVRLAAPEPPKDLPPRAPLNLAIVLDRSGSMSGRPLAEAKRCAQFIVESLSAQDRIAVVSFDDRVRIDAPSQGLANADAVRKTIARIESGGSTALHAGWLEGAAQAGAAAPQGAVSRVLLLTDGQANVGESNPAVLAEDCQRLAAAGVTTSTYGLGQSFNERLLSAMAESGQGQSYYGETAEDLMDPFREEFDLLAALYARKVRLALEPAPGVTVRILNRLRRDPEGRTQMPDIGYGAMGWALVRLTVPASLAEAGRGDLHVLTAHAVFETREGVQESCAPAQLRLPRVPPAAFESVAEDQETRARAQELRAAELQELARDAAYVGDWGQVDAALEAARREAGDNGWVAQSLDDLEGYARARDAARFSKSAHYGSAKMHRRLASFDEGAPYSTESESVKPGFLRRKPSQGKKLGDGE